MVDPLYFRGSRNSLRVSFNPQIHSARKEYDQFQVEDVFFSQALEPGKVPLAQTNRGFGPLSAITYPGLARDVSPGIEAQTIG